MTEVPFSATTSSSQSNSKAERRDVDNEELAEELVQQVRPFPPHTSKHNAPSSTSRHTSRSTVASWSPQHYPNPRSNAERCGLTQALKQQADDIIITSGLYTTEHALDKEADQALLCDPDAILGDEYLVRTAASLRNFTIQFGHFDSSIMDGCDDATLGDDDHDDDDDVSDPNTISTPTHQTEPNDTVHDSTSLRGRSLLSEKSPSNPSSIKNLQDVVLGGTFGVPDEPPYTPPVEVGIAVARKMNLQSILRADSYYSYEDEDDMVNDAAQYFARSLHDEWWAEQRHDASNDTTKNATSCHTKGPTPVPSSNGVLIFLSIQDRVCFISTGSAVSKILPWWRLERIVRNMKPDLRTGRYGEALVHAVGDLSDMLISGPPTLRERIADFIGRFGVVVAFAAFTFVFAAWGEYRDRQKRMRYAESRSRLTTTEKEKARSLQKEYHTMTCAICLEPFDFGDAECGNAKNFDGKKNHRTSGAALRRVDSFGIPLIGNDGHPLKMLRCGHVFDETCWRTWVNCGHGDPCKCPICRQDVGGKRSSSSSSLSSLSGSSRPRSAITEAAETTSSNSTQQQQEVGLSISSVTEPLSFVARALPDYGAVDDISSFNDEFNPIVVSYQGNDLSQIGGDDDDDDNDDEDRIDESQGNEHNSTATNDDGDNDGGRNADSTSLDESTSSLLPLIDSTTHTLDVADDDDGGDDILPEQQQSGSDLLDNDVTTQSSSPLMATRDDEVSDFNA